MRSRSAYLEQHQNNQHIIHRLPSASTEAPPCFVSCKRRSRVRIIPSVMTCAFRSRSCFALPPSPLNNENRGPRLGSITPQRRKHVCRNESCSNTNKKKEQNVLVCTSLLAFALLVGWKPHRLYHYGHGVGAPPAPISRREGSLP